MAVDTKEMLQTEPDISEGLDLSWMDTTGERGMRAHPGRRGLTLEEINKGSYGVAPENAEDLTMAQRGSARAAGVPRIGYHIRKKSDIWSDNDALRRGGAASVVIRDGHPVGRTEAAAR